MPVNRSAWCVFFLIGIIGVESARLNLKELLSNGGPCTGHRFDSARGTITTGFKVGDYVLGKCLGAGALGLAFDVTGNSSSAELIAKVQGTSEYDDNSKGYKSLEGARGECLIAQMIKKRTPSHAVDLLFSEALPTLLNEDDEPEFPALISIQEKAPGKELGSICSPSQDVTPAELPTLKDVFQKVVE